MYHAMSRGDRQERIFLDAVDRQDFIKTLAEACQKSGWQVHAYCLMPNHYHLVIETPEPNLVAGMAWLQSTYTIRLNHRHQLFGHVFSGRYRAQLVEGSGNGYLRTACDYVHLNPVRAGMLKAEDRLLSYPWSSFGAYLASPEHRPGCDGKPRCRSRRSPRAWGLEHPKQRTRSSTATCVGQRQARQTSPSRASQGCEVEKRTKLWVDRF